MKRDILASIEVMIITVSVGYLVGYLGILLFACLLFLNRNERYIMDILLGALIYALVNWGVSSVQQDVTDQCYIQINGDPPAWKWVNPCPVEDLTVIKAK